jgi:2-polyprenyl-3-methyl-5-hydroxy-6-metoxy-1,4-benzoquinol methylase
MAMAERVMRHFYRSANAEPARLPWHREQPVDVLVDTVHGLATGARALDVGCGAGVFAVWMATQGLRVTAIDLFP